jgi:hypothetical protein
LTFIAVVLGGLVVVGGITNFRLWAPLWNDWITSIDHKKIGIMYMILGLVMFLRGFADAVMMRLQQAMAFGDNRATCLLTTTTRSSPPRRDHDLLRGDALRDRPDELPGSSADRRT